MFQSIFTKIILQTKIIISGFIISISTLLGVPHDFQKPEVTATQSPSSIPSTIPIKIDNKKTTPMSTIKPTASIQIILPTLIPTPIPVLTYNDLHCPEIVRIEDSLGNISQTNMLSGTIKKSDTKQLTVEVVVSDPQNLVLSYQYSSAGLINENSTIKDWSKENSYTLNVESASIGTDRILFYSVDNQDGFSCAGDYTDIHGSFNYTIIP